MKFNIELNENQLAHLGTLFNEDPEVPASSTQVAQFMGACMKSALSLPSDEHQDIASAADSVVADINRGGWSMVGQPESTYETRPPT